MKVVTNFAEHVDVDNFRSRAGHAFLQLGSIDEANQLLAGDDTGAGLDSLEYHVARSIQARLDNEVDAAHVRTQLEAMRETADDQDKASIDHARATVEACLQQPHRAAASARKALGRRTGSAGTQASNGSRLAGQLLASLEQMAELSHNLGLYKDACLYLEKAIRYSNYAKLPIRELRLELALAELHLHAHREDEAASALAAVDAKLLAVQQSTSELLSILLQVHRLQLGARLDQRLSKEAAAQAQLEQAFDLLSEVPNSNTLVLNSRCAIAGELALMLATVSPSSFLNRMPEFVALHSPSAAVDALLQAQLGRAMLLSQTKTEPVDADVASLTGLFAAASLTEEAAEKNDLDEATLKKLKVVDLKELLKDRNLPVTGRKQDLINRLLESQASSSQSPVPRASGAVSPLFDTPHAFLQQALSRGPELLTSQEQRLLHLSLARSLQKTEAPQAVFYHSLSQGIATRLEAAGLGNSERYVHTYAMHARARYNWTVMHAHDVLINSTSGLGSSLRTISKA